MECASLHLSVSQFSPSWFPCSIQFKWKTSLVYFHYNDTLNPSTTHSSHEKNHSDDNAQNVHCTNFTWKATEGWKIVPFPNKKTEERRIHLYMKPQYEFHKYYFVFWWRKIHIISNLLPWCIKHFSFVFCQPKKENKKQTSEYMFSIFAWQNEMKSSCRHPSELGKLGPMKSFEWIASPGLILKTKQFAHVDPWHLYELHDLQWTDCYLPHGSGHPQVDINWKSNYTFPFIRMSSISMHKLFKVIIKRSTSRNVLQK